MRPLYSKQRWQQIQSLMDAVLDLPEAGQLSLLRQKCAGDLELLTAVRSLLQAQRDAPDFLDQPAIELAGPLTTAQADAPSIDINGTDFSGQCIGPYRLCEVIGRGGMGLVFRAERCQGAFEQQVAIKLLSANQMSDRGLERFEQEQQLLASLIHPGIAQLYDGGTTASGQAYFVMEYVAGVPIDQYCDSLRLTVEQRLKLVWQIATALSFAHQHLIVHRDIKSSNILVNQQGQVKLLDFGIAKLLKPPDQRAMTHTGEQLMTPGCAAPEQLQNQKISVATNVYQLGLILYQMLTAYPAYHQYPCFSDRVRVICTQPPVRPSLLLAKNGHHTAAPALRQAGIENSRLRRCTVPQLEKKLSGDLDAMVLKMLHNKPQYRYPSMEAFSADLAAYFNHRPVQARNPTIGYQIGKIIQRYWKTISITALFVILLIGYSATIAYQAEQTRLALIRSEIEQDKSQRVSDFLIRFFKSADPNVAGLDVLSAKQVLEKGHLQMVKALQNVPEIQAHMLTLLGEIYLSQGDAQTSIELLQTSLDTLRKIPAANLTDSLTLANTLTQLGLGYMAVGEYDKALGLLNESLHQHQQIQPRPGGNGQHHQARIKQGETLSSLGEWYYAKGRHQQAEQYLKQAVSLLEPVNGGAHEGLATAFNNLALIEHPRGNFVAARSLMAKAIAIQRAVLGENHSYYSLHLVNSAIMLTDMGYLDEAQALLNQALTLQKALLGPQHSYVAASYRALGRLKYKQGQLASAAAHLRTSLEIKAQLGQSTTMPNAFTYLWLGAVLQDQQNFAGASHALAQMMRIFRSTAVSDEIMGRGLVQMASLAVAQNQLEQAAQHYRNAMALMQPEGVRITLAQVGYSQLLLQLGQPAAAQPLLRAALLLRIKSFAPDHYMVAEVQLLLGLVLHHLGDGAGASDGLSQALAILNHQPLFQFGNRRRLLDQANQLLP